jgi:protein O-GlcNAc transferase
MTNFFAEIETPQITILDIGASFVPGQKHEFADLVRRGKARLVGFEPIAKECALLNLKKGPNEQYLPYLLGDGTDCTLFITKSAFCSSMLEPNAAVISQFQAYKQMFAIEKKISMPSTRLDAIEGIESGVDLIKIDVQGGELEVLSAGVNVLAKTLAIKIEVWFIEFYQGQPLFAEVDQFLRKAGFRFLGLSGFGGQKLAPFAANKYGDSFPLAQLIWCDATYVRDLSASLDPDCHLKMALIYFEIFRAIDFAHLHLKHYDDMTGTRHAASLIAQNGIVLP